MLRRHLPAVLPGSGHPVTQGNGRTPRTPERIRGQIDGKTARPRCRRLSKCRNSRDKPEAYPTYWVTVRRPVWVRTPPTPTTTGCTPRGAVAGTVKLTCETPARPIGVPAKE